MSVRHLGIVAGREIAEAYEPIAEREADSLGPTWLWLWLISDPCIESADVLGPERRIDLHALADCRPAELTFS
ncbi:hypothetical protein [Lichenibacterium minor]|uniref:hypothetical protein n=1 Tax=Lichenibacterium minor TaxID=2316528 RepID=UPI0013EE2320|nr:hypothetical protein [Lichenibacterium minor]